VANIYTGDGPAAADAMGMKRPGNAVKPCHTCDIRATRMHQTQGTLYVPHMHTQNYPYENPPIHTNLRRVIELVMATGSEATKTEWGITRTSILLQLRSLHFPRSFPADIMHLVLLNITEELFMLWNQTKLAIDDSKSGDQYNVRVQRSPYLLSNQSLKIIGTALYQSRPDIPAFLGHAPRPIDRNYKGFKASEWKAWLLLYGVPLLDQHLPSEYVENFRVLGQLYSLATRHSLLEVDVSSISSLAARFVKSFEQLYYKGESNRLSVCTVNIHMLLHLSQYIRDLEPACYWWQFPMERFCGIIKPYARSKSQMNASLANAVLFKEHLNHIRFTKYAEETASAADSPLPELLDAFVIRLSPYQKKHIRYSLKRNIEQADGFKRCQLRRDLLIGSVKSQRRTDVNRNNSRICFRRPGKRDMEFGEVQYFAHISEFGQFAWIRTFANLDIDKRKGIVSYKGFGQHVWIQAEWIQSLIGILREGETQLIITDVDLFGW
jgi:hypothetical protein